MSDYVFHPEAETEHLETISYLESRQAGLGALYLAAFEASAKQACEHSQRYPIALPPDIRRIRLVRFPYSIIFRATSEGIQILAVAHHRRRPDYWRTRR